MNTTFDISTELEAALAHHQQGDLQQAMTGYQLVLDNAPDNIDALHLLGVAQFQANNIDSAISLLEKTLALNPKHIYALLHYGIVLENTQRFNEALIIYERALAIAPDDASILFNYGNALQSLERYAEAIAAYDHALTIMPHDTNTLFNRGNALRITKHFDDAIHSYTKAIELMPDHVNALHNRGNILQELELFNAALNDFNRILAITPNHIQTLIDKGHALQKLQLFQEALTHYEHALTIVPDNIDFLLNRGHALDRLNRTNEALSCYNKILTIDPNHIHAIYCRGNTLKALQRYQEALVCYNKAIMLDPSFAKAHFNEATTRLLIGDFKHGWEKYEWRWKRDDVVLTMPHYDKPLWMGKESLKNKTLLVHIEQGFGDLIQFCRYTKLIKQAGAKIVLATVSPALLTLLKQINDIDYLVTSDEPLPHFDYYCPLMSLPLIYQTTLANIPAHTPYFHAPKMHIKKWKTTLKNKGKPRIGIAWSGNPIYSSDYQRSIPLEKLTALLACKADFYCLQKEIRPADQEALSTFNNMHILHHDIEDFADTAAIIAAMDIVISVDTSIAHLAGAMGKPMWVMLPYVAEWRWLTERSDSPWYPSAHLIRQQKIGDWASVIEQVKNKLNAFIHAY